MRCRSGVIITPPKRDDPTLCFWHTTVFLPQSGFVQQAITLRTPSRRECLARPIQKLLLKNLQATKK